MRFQEVQTMLTLLLAAVMYVKLLPLVLRYIVFGDLRKVVALFQPRWKREAEFLARSIPEGGPWS